MFPDNLIYIYICIYYGHVPQFPTKKNKKIIPRNIRNTNYFVFLARSSQLKSDAYVGPDWYTHEKKTIHLGQQCFGTGNMYFSAVIVGSATGGCDGRDLFSRVGADSGTVSGCITGSGSFRLQCNDCVVGDHLLQYLPVCFDCGGIIQRKQHRTM
jgi:hypothetical protein